MMKYAKKNNQTIFKKRTKKFRLLNWCLAILVFVSTYGLLSPNAITMENPAPPVVETDNGVTCTVWNTTDNIEVSSSAEPVEVSSVAPSSQAPVVESSVAPSSQAPIVESSIAPSSVEPVVESSVAPSSVEPVVECSVAPSSQEPVVECSVAPSSQEPVAESSVAPSSQEPVAESSVAPSSQEPVVESSVAPSSAEPVEVSSIAPSSQAPIVESSVAPSSQEPVVESSVAPSSQEPVVESSVAPSSQEPVVESSVAPSSQEPVVESSVAPSSQEPTEVSSTEPSSEPNILEQTGSFVNGLLTQMLAPARAPSSQVNLAPFITKDKASTPNIDEDGFKVFVKQGNKWVESTKFQIGDEIKVSIDYAVIVPNGKNYNQLYYQLPGSAVYPEQQLTGNVKNKEGKVVGTYTINTNGLITIDFSDDKNVIDTTKSYEGNLTFQGTVNESNNNKETEVVFDEENLTFDYKQPDPVTNITPDISIDKDYEGKVDNNLKYSLTVSSTNGTNGEDVTITDTFTKNTDAGLIDANYVQNTFKVTKTLSNGTVVPVTGYDLNINNNATPSTFSITNLPFLNPGEKYNVEYQATPITNVQNGDDGGKSVKNTAKVTSDTKNDDDTTTTVVETPVIDKVGSLDSRNEQVVWTVTINPEGNISGYKITDKITATKNNGNNVNISQATTATLTYTKNGKTTTKEINLPYTFVTDDNGGSDYKITYITDTSNLPVDTEINLDNNVTLGKNDIEYSDNHGVPGVYNSRYDFDKTFESVETITDTEEETIKKYNWQTTIKVPSNGSTSNLKYKDEINTTLKTDKYSTTIQDAHYTTVSELRKMTIKVDGKDVDSTKYKIQYVELDVSGAKDLTSTTNNNIKVSDFYVIFTEAYVNSIKNKTIVLNYSTIADLSNIVSNRKYDIENSAVIGSQKITAQTPYQNTPDSGIEKNSISPVDGTFNKDPMTFDYDSCYDKDLGCSVLTYRVTFNAANYTKEQLFGDKNGNGKLILTDILPKGTELITDNKNSNDNQNPIEYYFVMTDNPNKLTQQSFQWPTGKYKQSYKCFKYKLGTTTVDDETRNTVTFELTDYFKNNYDAFVEAKENFTNIQPLNFYIVYKIKLPEKSEWDETYSKTFENYLQFGDEHAKNEVTITSNDKFVSKAGTKEDKNVNYTIVVNENGKDMDGDHDEIVLTDTLKFIGTNDVVATLDHSSFEVFEYSETADNHIGRKLTTDEYSYETELITQDGSSSYIFNLTIPDGKALIVKYTYDIDSRKDNSVSFKVENSVLLHGSAEYEDNTQLEIIKPTTEGTVVQQNLLIHKYDTDSEGKSLQGAVFEFKKYQGTNGSDEWSGSIFGTEEQRTTDINGMLNVALNDVDNEYEPDVLYSYKETVAPTGYKLDHTTMYFVVVSDSTLENFDDYFNDLAKPSYVTKDRVTFITKSTHTLNVANEKIEQYALPSTGGANKTPYGIAVILFIGATIIYKILIKREVKNYAKHY